MRLIRIKAAFAALAEVAGMDPDLDSAVVGPTEAARSRRSHPLRRIWRGLGNVALFYGECLIALGDLFFRRGPDRPRRRKRHPVEKAAPFPIND